jgi:hypothetical protein
MLAIAVKQAVAKARLVAVFTSMISPREVVTPEVENV